jgi:hypothetical protein
MFEIYERGERDKICQPILLTAASAFAVKYRENKKRANQLLSDLPVLVVPAGIEPASSESESEILSIVLRNH